MSKRNNDGDVIENRLSLVEAKGQRLLASLFGSQPYSPAVNGGATLKDEDDDLKAEYGHDRLGVGGILPKDFEDGSFTKRQSTSNDKLLEQLIGKKRAEAHLAAKQEAARSSAKPQRRAKPTPTKREESEDEEEGRASTFNSKKRKKISSKSGKEGSGDGDEKLKALSNEGKASHVETQDKQIDDDEKFKDAQSSQKAPIRSKIKPKSFLDEILADRSKKKKMKDRAQI